jgi:hypothetical protein
MEITSHSKLFDVLEAYPELEAQIINIAPPFKNLKNPVLRRTVGKMATLDKVAQIGGMDVTRLVNTLRKAAGQPELTNQPAAALVVAAPMSSEALAWITGEPAAIINGTEMLARGEVPLGKVNETLERLSPGQYLLLVTNFEPVPIIDVMKKQNRRVYHEVRAANADQHLTYIGVND